MIYRTSLTIPALTADTAPETKVLPLMRGVVERFSLILPPGCYGLVGVQVFYHEFQIFPLTKGEWFTGDDVEVEFDEEVEIGERPYEIEVRGYNSDDYYEHEVFVLLRLREPGPSPWARVEGAIREGLERPPYPSEEWLAEAGDALSGILTLLSETILPMFEKMIDDLNYLKRVVTPERTLQDIARI